MESSHFNHLQIKQQLLHFLNEDIGQRDITSETIVPPDKLVLSEIVCKSEESAVVCGLDEVSMLFSLCDPDIKISRLVDESSVINKGTIVMKIFGNARSILKSERTALNLLMRMSGIATETKKFVDKIQDAKTIYIASTRKTAPGLRFFDKKAVVGGGGISHRMQLSEMVLIKDNHIAIAGSVKQAITSVKETIKDKIECEVRSFEEAIDSIKYGSDIILLDNFSPKEVSRTIEHLEAKGLRKQVIIEVSGGININNISDYAVSKPDIISIGYLTHSSKAIDFSLEIYNK